MNDAGNSAVIENSIHQRIKGDDDIEEITRHTADHPVTSAEQRSK